MKFFRRKLKKQIEQVQESGTDHVQKRPYIIPMLGLFLSLAIVAGVIAGSKPIDKPSDAHVVFLTDNGKKRVIDTKAKTVGELLGRLKLNLVTQDVVEPTTDTEIPEDNFRINIYRARPVTLNDNGNKVVALTAQRSARVVAQQAGLSLRPEDVVRFEQGNLDTNVIGEQISISRANPVNLNLYGTAFTTYTQAKTIGDFLKEKQITLNTGESVQPDQKALVSPGMEIFVLSKDAKLVNAQEDIAIPNQIVQDSSLSFGTTVVRQNGSTGKRTVTYLIQTDSSGKETGRSIIHETIIQAAVPKITAKGTAIDINSDRQSVMSAAGISKADYQYANYIISRESNWHVTAQNASGAYGLCQALPGSKMSSAGSDWSTNPVTQLKWCDGYADRYGGWAGSYNFWLAHHYW